MRMTRGDFFNTIIGGVSASKVIAATNRGKIEVKREDVKNDPIYDASNYYEVVPNTYYDTAYLPINVPRHLFLSPVSQHRGYDETNMVCAGRIPEPNSFVIRGMGIKTDVDKIVLEYIMAELQIGSKIYRRIPLSDLPYEDKDGLVIIPPWMYFTVRLQNEKEMLPIRGKIRILLVGYDVRAIQ